MVPGGGRGCGGTRCVAGDSEAPGAARTAGPATRSASVGGTCRACCSSSGNWDLAISSCWHFSHAITDFWENGWAGLMTDTQARLKARAQERLLAKASRLSLAALERPDF